MKLHNILVFSLIWVARANENSLLQGARNLMQAAVNKQSDEPNICDSTEDIPQNESIIQNYLDSTPSIADKFFIQGWRWHHLSIVRDAKRLNQYASVVKSGDEEDLEPLKKAVDFVFNFNLRGLSDIEDKVFFPWLREKLLNSEYESEETKKAFASMIEDVDQDRKRVKDLASKIVSYMDLATENSVDQNMRRDALDNIITNTDAVYNLTNSIKAREDKFLVPALMKNVSSREQKFFNNKVLRSLGILQSRKYLIGMYDAVHDPDYGNEEEQTLFVEQIPLVARMMIGSWRKSLYEPEVGMLDLSPSDS